MTSEAKERELQDLVDRIRRLLIDSTVEEKRLVIDAVNVWIAYEESTYARQKQ
jgi:hypothetical protein